MAEVYADMPELSYVVADCRDMAQFSGQQFDAVLDKGTLDALMCSDTSDHDVRAMLSEVSRVLCPGGVFVEVPIPQPSPHVIKAFAPCTVHPPACPALQARIQTRWPDQCVSQRSTGHCTSSLS